MASKIDRFVLILAIVLAILGFCSMAALAWVMHDMVLATMFCVAIVVLLLAIYPLRTYILQAFKDSNAPRS